MECALIHGDLVAYHSASASGAERAAIEAHLLTCRACLRDYLAIKAHADGEREAPGPREEARVKLRAAVGARFRPTWPRALRRWLAHPVALRRGVVAAAVVALLAAVGPRVLKSTATQPAAHAAERVDSARPFAQSPTIY